MAMNAETTVRIRERISGLLLVPGGAPSIYSLAPGSIVTIVEVKDDSHLVEVQANGHRLLLSSTVLEQNSEGVFSA